MMQHACDLPFRVRDLTTSQIGRLIKMRGQVVRSHPVHPELVVGAFRCADCGTVVRGVEQQFKYTQPSVCYNPQCSNRVKFELITEESKFVDFQKVRIQVSCLFIESFFDQDCVIFILRCQFTHILKELILRKLILRLIVRIRKLQGRSVMRLRS